MQAKIIPGITTEEVNFTVKGTTIAGISEYIKKKYGQDNYLKWKESLHPKSKEIFNRTILASANISVFYGLSDPILKMEHLHQSGKLNKEELHKIGEFAATYEPTKEERKNGFIFEGVLRKMQKVLLTYGSPRTTIKGAAKFINLHLHLPDPDKPSPLIESGLPMKSEYQEFEANKNNIIWKVYDIYDKTGIWEEIAIGWIKGVIILCGGENPKIIATKSPARGADYYEFELSWDEPQ